MWRSIDRDNGLTFAFCADLECSSVTTTLDSFDADGTPAATHRAKPEPMLGFTIAIANGLKKQPAADGVFCVGRFQVGSSNYK